MLVKEFKLRQGARHTQDGQAVQVGDTVQLTKAQATAFRDKFEAVDDSDFEEVENVEPYKPQAGEENGETKGATEEAPQGQPVAQPPVTIGNAAPEGPADPHTLDPARQGQQSTEQRDIIDSGNAPPPAVFSGSAKSMDSRSEAPTSTQANAARVPPLVAKAPATEPK